MEHTVVFLLRLLPETPREVFALWQVAAEDFRPVLGVLLDGQLEGSGGPRSLLEGRGHWCSTASEALHAHRGPTPVRPPAFRLGVSRAPCPAPQPAESR